MRKKSQEFLFDYLKATSPVTYEVEGQKIWLDYIRPYIHDYFTDSYGTVVGVVNPEAQYKVVIEAHADEIAWYVKYISNDGYIYVERNGGSDPVIAPSQKVSILTKDGKVQGVFGWPAIHVRNRAKDTLPTMQNVFIDIGASSKQEVLDMGVHVGSIAVFDAEPMILNDKYITGRALDNRLGGFVIAEVLRKLHKNNVELPFGLYIVNAVQEEIGLRGAEMIANRIKPDLAIVTDVCHDSSAPLYDKKRDCDTKGGNGPVMCYAPSVHLNVLNRMIETAEKQEIPFQRIASYRSSGTDTDAFAYSNDGVPSVLVSTALKYMHTTVETVHMDDVKNIIKLFYHFIKGLKGNEDFRFMK